MPPQSLVDSGVYTFTPVKFRLPYAVDGFNFEPKAAPVSQMRLSHCFLSGVDPEGTVIYNSVPKFRGKYSKPAGHEKVVVWGLVFEEKLD